MVIQSMTSTADEYGQVTGWQDVDEVWASIEPLRGREFFEAQQVHSELTTRIRLRYRSDVTPDMRIVDGEDVYTIVVVQPDKRRGELTLLCRMVQS